MGGRGSAGGRSGGGGATRKTIPTGEGITDKNELIDLYNHISGNMAYTTEQRVKAMESIRERINELDAKKAADLKQKRLDALAKARAKRAENLKNGIKPEKKPKVSKAKMSVDNTISDLKSTLRQKVKSDYGISNSSFRIEDYGDTINVSVRYLGKWKNPSREQDYDWQELHQSSRKQIEKVVQKLAKRSGRKISWGASEKNWIDFDIEKKKGD